MKVICVRLLALLPLLISVGYAVEPGIVSEQTMPVVGDADKGRVVAQRCADCHGLDGVSAASGAPFIAGMKQEYLVRSLLAYANGARNHTAMQQVSMTLNPLMLADVTAYYAGLKTVWQGAVAGQKSRAILSDAGARGAAEHIVTACRSCHIQTDRFQKAEAIPSLDGMPLEYFVPALKSYLRGERQNDIMSNFASSLGEQDGYNLAAYFAARIPAKTRPPENGNPVTGKIIARACAGCHGYDGNSLNPHIPNLAGQSARYLVKAVKDYRDGARNALLMQAPVQTLSDAMIEDLAAYFSHQTPQSQLHTDITSAQAFNPLADGEKIAASCNTCHGENGNSHTAGVPNLTGLAVKYIVKATQAYQQGGRRHAAMQEMVSFFSDTDIEKAAYYYAMQAPQSRNKQIGGNSDTGEVLSARCTSCHGVRGVSNDPDTIPGLAGQDETYIIAALKAYIDGRRKHKVMKDVAQTLDDQAMQDLAAYYAAQTPQQVETYLPDDPARLAAERCSRCHGERGYSEIAGVPRLAGQIESYIVLAMKEYQDGVRNNTTMIAMADVLSLLEIKAIAAYYAKQ